MRGAGTGGTPTTRATATHPGDNDHFLRHSWRILVGDRDKTSLGGPRATQANPGGLVAWLSMHVAAAADTDGRWKSKPVATPVHPRRRGASFPPSLGDAPGYRVPKENKGEGRRERRPGRGREKKRGREGERVRHDRWHEMTGDEMRLDEMR